MLYHTTYWCSTTLSTGALPHYLLVLYHTTYWCSITLYWCSTTLSTNALPHFLLVLYHTLYWCSSTLSTGALPHYLRMLYHTIYWCSTTLQQIVIPWYLCIYANGNLTLTESSYPLFYLMTSVFPIFTLFILEIPVLQISPHTFWYTETMLFRAQLFIWINGVLCRSQWPRGLRRG